MPGPRNFHSDGYSCSRTALRASRFFMHKPRGHRIDVLVDRRGDSSLPLLRTQDACAALSGLGLVGATWTQGSALLRPGLPYAALSGLWFSLHKFPREPVMNSR